MSHHATLSPSKLDKLNECLHFEGKPAGPAAKRGTEIHEKLAEAFKRREAPKDPLLLRAYNRAKGYLARIDGIEEKVQLLNDSLEQVTFGTADLYGRSGNDTLVLVDFKSGSQPAASYYHQMAAYALMLMEQEDEESCTAVIIPVDDEDNEAFAIDFTRESAAEVIWPLIERVKAKDENPRENQFCNWCAKRSQGCPVWNLPAAEALAPVREKLLFTQEDALTHPEAYMDAFKKLEGIFEDWGIKEALKAKLESGIAVPGWKLQTRKGSQSVSDVEEVLLKVVKAVGTTKASQFLKVDAGKMVKVWESFSSDPLPVEVTQGEGTTALVQDKKGGAK